jgi:hypothetical protein
LPVSRLSAKTVWWYVALLSGVTIASKKIVREPMSMYSVPVMPMWAGPTDPPGGFFVAYWPIVVGPVSQITAPVVAL